MCATDVTRMRSCMSYRKLLNCKDVLEHYFEIAHYVFALLGYEERDEISPICLVVVPLIACLLALGVDPSI